MKTILISDTHNYEKDVILPVGDLLIHAGDFTVGGSLQEVTRFAKWLERVVPHYEHGCVLIAGNHELALDPNKCALYKLAEDVIQAVPNVHYLNDSEVTIEHEGVPWKIWGSPITPEFGNYAFNRDRGFSIKRHWKLIPDDVNILVTHGPPKGIRDRGLGCQDLTFAVEGKKDLYLHVFGHIHPPYGTSKIDRCTFVNASQCIIEEDWLVGKYGRQLVPMYKLKNEPIIVNLKKE